MAADLAALRAKGDALDSNGLCKLIIPNDQIRYLTIETEVSDSARRRDMARAALEGATPYAVSDLAFDLSEDGSQTHIAAVAHETLAEAESFALENGFTPASFVAAPGGADFLGEPFFGAATSLGDQEIEPDGIAVVDIGPAKPPQPQDKTPRISETKAPAPQEPEGKDKISHTKTPAAKAVLTLPEAPAELDPDAPASGSGLSDKAVQADSGPIAGFSSRRRKPTGAPPSRPDAGAATSKTAKIAATVEAPHVKPAPAATANPKNEATKPIGPARAATVAGKTGSGGKFDASAANPKEGGAFAPVVAPPRPANGTGAANPVQASHKPLPAEDRAATTRPAISPAAAQAANSLGTEGTKGKPRHLGLILTAALLLTMAAIAAFALFSEGGSFFASERAPLEVSEEEPPLDPPAERSAPTPEPAENIAPAEADVTQPAAIPLSENETEPVSIAPQVSVIPDQPDPGIVEQAAPESQETEAQLHASTGKPVLDTLDEESTPQEAEATEDQTEREAARSAAALYAATGIWQQVPQITQPPALVSLDDMYIASIDNSNLSQDAIALSLSPGLEHDTVPNALSDPAAAGRGFELDNRGLVTASPDGTLNPDGVMVYLGRPKVVPPATPARAALDAADTEAENARIATLSQTRPRPRPSDLVEQAERAILGGLSRAELARVRPRARPASLKTEEQENQPVSSLAVASSTAPRSRPANFANLVDRATRQHATAAASSATAATAAPPTVSPSIPSSASVARQATINNAINLRRVNLIGIFGKPSNRQALIRLPSGRTRQVSTGDRLDGGTVLAIGESQLQYQKRSKNIMLELPGN
ncbi:hypothetical protein [Pseudophaeobacter flagellatus]|uniref:hypothetical protein n=1 Tax=Pseudophaeobacter flagellatus TaxID=2899119 RepID=UPI001E51FEC0|nr:hypothetical protein [Pseudophaeobacter flagellatus]MCD9146218.1 hypothetical protein [Pseudophaeobacter flagellatus]